MQSFSTFVAIVISPSETDKEEKLENWYNEKTQAICPININTDGVGSHVDTITDHPYSL